MFQHLKQVNKIQLSMNKNSLFILFHRLTNSSTSCYQPRCFCHEPIDVRKTFIPQMDWDINNICYEAKGRHWRVKKECIQVTLVSMVC